MKGMGISLKFVELSEKEFEAFASNHPLRTFMQTKEIAELRKLNGYDVYYVGVKKDKKILCATMMSSIKSYFGFRKFYSPRGFLIDYNDTELLSFFTHEIKKYIKKKKGYILRIDPYLMYHERDINGDIVEGGINNEKAVSTLLNLGFKKVPENHFEQVSWMFALDVKGKTIDEIFSNMKQNTRNIIRNLEKEKITIRELSYDELPIFMDVMESTAKRRTFVNRDLGYYQKMYNIFKDKVKYLVSELDLKEYIKNLNEEIKLKEERLNNLKDIKSNAGKKKELIVDIESKKKKKEEAILLQKEEGNKIILSASMFILTKPEVIYLFSGNYKKYMNFKSQYLIQWHMIKYAIENGYDRYNFYGIPANINTKPENYDLYTFKKGFDGYVIELIGEYALPINNIYYIIELIKKIRGNI